MRIDDLKGAISSRGGLQYANRFDVYITHPVSSFNASRVQEGNLIRRTVDQFRNRGALSTRDFIASPRDLYLLCESVQMPGRRIGTLDHSTSMKVIKKPNEYLVDDVSMTFRITNDFYTWNYFNSWLDIIIERDIIGSAHKVRYKTEYATEVIIRPIGQNHNVPAKAIRLVNAFPITLENVELSDDSQGTPSRCTVSFSYDDWIEDNNYESLNQFHNAIEGSSNYLSFASTVRNAYNLAEQTRSDYVALRQFFDFF